jgi:hypothetical protein
MFSVMDGRKLILIDALLWERGRLMRWIYFYAGYYGLKA